MLVACHDGITGGSMQGHHKQPARLHVLQAQVVYRVHARQTDYVWQLMRQATGILCIVETQ
jgi:hypothetical protein